MCQVPGALTHHLYHEIKIFRAAAILLIILYEIRALRNSRRRFV